MSGPPLSMTMAAVASLLRSNSSRAVSRAWTSSAINGGRPGISRGFWSAFADELVEEQARDHVERFKDALATGGDRRERGRLHFAIVEQELHVFDGSDIGQVALVVLENVRDFGKVKAESLEVLL